mgnify:CR=1 FL=1
MKLTETRLRQIIREELSREQEELVKQVLSDEMGYDRDDIMVRAMGDGTYVAKAYNSDTGLFSSPRRYKLENGLPVQTRFQPKYA